MRQETRQALCSLKEQALEASRHLAGDELEEFYGELNEWAYGEYEKSLVCRDMEMQDYEED